MRSASGQPGSGELGCDPASTGHGHEQGFRAAADLRTLAEDRATDVLYTLNHPTLYDMLVGRLGWSAEQYESWLVDTLVEQLLEPSGISG